MLSIAQMVNSMVNMNEKHSDSLEAIIFITYYIKGI